LFKFKRRTVVSGVAAPALIYREGENGYNTKFHDP